MLFAIAIYEYYVHIIQHVSTHIINIHVFFFVNYNFEVFFLYSERTKRDRGDVMFATTAHFHFAFVDMS